MKVTCLPSTTQNRAGNLSECLILAIEERVFDWLFGGARMRILTPRVFAFCRAFLRTSDLRLRPVLVVMMTMSFSAFLIAEVR